MKTAVVSITLNGVDAGLKLLGALKSSVLFAPEHVVLERSLPSKSVLFKSPLKSVVKTLMTEYDGIVFIMAAGIVVRLIAPFLVDKRTDPAVVVMDENGNNVISLLSGHLGGANALAERVATVTNGNPVITTASDVRNKPAIDMLSEECGCVIENPERVPSFMRAFLDGLSVALVDPDGHLGGRFEAYENVAFFSSPYDVPDSGITEMLFVSNKIEKAGKMSGRTLLLRPKNIIAGVGCRRGASSYMIEEAFKRACGIAEVSPFSLKTVATVDIKKDEQGLLDFADRYRATLCFYSADQINMETGNDNRDGRVKFLIGVSGVCEPCAALAGGRGKLILKKVKHRKTVTIALAVAE